MDEMSEVQIVVGAADPMACREKSDSKSAT